MSARIWLLLGCTLALSSALHAQQLRTYTQTASGANSLVYGLPVPLPIDSLTPVDGFRSYASIEARLQGLSMSSDDLSAHNVGQSIAGRTIWAYVVSDEDGVDVEGRPEAAFFIRSNVHAREWGAPEVGTGTIERLIAGADDGGVTRYLLDNTRLVIIPVFNVDGLLQTQRFPTDVLLGQDPDFPNDWPRDGRMRRKNMRGVDEVLATTGDHLNGIDLNRNSPPFWNTTPSRSSSDVRSLVYHGAAPHSEPENQAMLQAAMLGPETRYRLGIDVHSFSSVFFSSNTGRTRLNGIQTALIGNLSAHHGVISGKFYPDLQDPPNRGIGTASEYFSYQWLVPGWTLELEPQNDVSEYGGTNVTHSGFILPASEARRVRDSWAETHFVAFYQMAGPPHLSRVRVFDVQSGALVSESRWQYNAQSGRRDRINSVPGAMQPGRLYRAEFGFSKPMRNRGSDGAVTPLPGLALVEQPISVILRQGQNTIALGVASGSWINDPARVLRYRDDTFALEFTAPDQVADYQLDVAVTDMTGRSLDTDPATPADWSAGAWSQYQNDAGVEADFGGTDRSNTLSVAPAGSQLVEILDDPRIVGEGDRVALRINRPVAGAEQVQVSIISGAAPGASVSWAAGESGIRMLPVTIEEDLDAQGDRSVVVQLGVLADGSLNSSPGVTYSVLDNDSADGAVMRMRTAQGLGDVWDGLRNGPVPRDLVLDGDLTVVVPVREADSGPPALGAVEGELRVHGNGATLDIADTFGPNAFAIEVAPQGTLSLDRINMNLRAADSPRSTEGIRNAGSLTFTRGEIRSGGLTRGDVLLSSGDLLVDRSLFRMAVTHDQSLIRIDDGSALLHSSTVSESEGFSPLMVRAGQLRVQSTTFIGNSAGARLFFAIPPQGVPEFGHVLIQDNSLSNNESPPVNENCDLGVGNIGFNIENRFRCGFDVNGGFGGVDLGDFSFDPALQGYAPIGIAIDGGAILAQAEASGCGLVDQRGAPRPQTMTPGAVPRCDVGAIELGINPYRGIWAPARSGHGVDIQTTGNTLFLAWYTYDDDGQPTAYQAAAPLTGPHWEATLQRSSRNNDSGAYTVADVGQVTLDFDSDTEAQLGWRFTSRGVTGSERITASLFAPGTPRFEVTGLWFPPAEPGYGATISRRGEVTAIGVYYYDAQGNVRWALGTGNAADALSLQMTSFTGFCPDCDAATMPVVGAPGGSVLAHFRTPGSARIDMQLTYPGAAGGMWQRQQVRFVPLNDLVDNHLTVAAAGSTQ